MKRSGPFSGNCGPFTRERQRHNVRQVWWFEAEDCRPECDSVFPAAFGSWEQCSSLDRCTTARKARASSHTACRAHSPTQPTTDVTQSPYSNGVNISSTDWRDEWVSEWALS